MAVPALHLARFLRGRLAGRLMYAATHPISVTREAFISGGSAGLRSACLPLGNPMPSGCPVRVQHVRDLLPEHLLFPEFCCAIWLVGPCLLPSHVPWNGCRKRPRRGERRGTSCLLSGGGCWLSAPLLNAAHIPEPGTSLPVDRAFSGPKGWSSQFMRVHLSV